VSIAVSRVPVTVFTCSLRPVTVFTCTVIALVTLRFLYLTIGSRIKMSKRPPEFIEGSDYEQWKKDVNLWCTVSELEESKHAIVIHLSLTGRARNATSEISAADNSGKSSTKKIFEKLDRVYLQDVNWKCFHTYLDFENFKRAKTSTVDEYLSEFDLRLHKLKECKVDLPDAIVACRLLKSCDLSDVHFQMALSTCDTLTFENMRKTLKRLFAENNHLLTGDSVKIENDAFYGNSFRGRGFNRRGRGDYSGRGGFSCIEECKSLSSDG